MSTKTDDLARDEILYLPIGLIHPDPEQPRLEVDDELADSIRQHGVLQAIQVRPHPVLADQWQLVDGERRYRGALRAKLPAIPATLSIDVEDPADRIIRQIVRNEGKPLTPVEEALAFKRIIDAKRSGGDKKYGLIQLSRDLGIPKSTVADRLMVTEIPAFWLDLIAKGPLQASHVPLLHKWRKVPEKYQHRALEQMQGDYRWAGGDSYSKAKKGERIYVSVFQTLLRTYMTKFVKPVREVPGYDGPTEKGRFEPHGDSTTYAMDPAKWQPIHRRLLGEKRSKQGKQAAETKDINTRKRPAWVTAAIDGGAELVDNEKYFRPENFEYGERFKGCTAIIARGAWYFVQKPGGLHLFDPPVLCARQDLSKLVIVEHLDHNYNTGRTQHEYYAATRDNAALGQAVSAYKAERTRRYADFTKEAYDWALAHQMDVAGAGAGLVLRLLANAFGQDVYDICAAFEIAPVLQAKKRDELPAVLAKLPHATQETLVSGVATLIGHPEALPTIRERLEQWEQHAAKNYSRSLIQFGSTKDKPAEAA